MEMIILQSITKNYDEIVALDNINLHVMKGEVFSVIGSNGSGKTTLLRIMAGIENQTAGTMFFDGKKIHKEDLGEVRRKGTLVFQKTSLFNTTVNRNIAYGLKLRKLSRKTINQTVKESLNIVKLEGYGKRLANSLSGGEQQRVALARALALNTNVLFLDEPTANLDPKNVSIVEEAIMRINRERETTIVIATHNMAQAKSLSERTMVLIDGKIQQIGKSKDIFKLSSIADLTRIENIFTGISTILKEGTPSVKLDNGISIATTIRQEGHVTLYIRPEDIILSKDKIVSSARNVFKGQIVKITDLGHLVKLKIDAGQEFIVQITKRSFEEMNLNIGLNIYLTFKAGSVHVV